MDVGARIITSYILSERYPDAAQEIPWVQKRWDLMHDDGTSWSTVCDNLLYYQRYDNEHVSVSLVSPQVTYLAMSDGGRKTGSDKKSLVYAYLCPQLESMSQSVVSVGDRHITPENFARFSSNTTFYSDVGRLYGRDAEQEARLFIHYVMTPIKEEQSRMHNETAPRMWNAKEAVLYRNAASFARKNAFSQEYIDLLDDLYNQRARAAKY